GEGAVARGDLAVADPDGPGGPGTLQSVRGDVVAAAPELVAVVEGRIDEGLHLVPGQGVEHTFVVVDREQEPHGTLLRSFLAGRLRFIITPSVASAWLRTLDSRSGGAEVDTRVGRLEVGL